MDLALPAEGVFHNLVFVSIRKTYPMEACKSLRTATHAQPLGHESQMLFTKYIIVVDDDVDVHNISEVLFLLRAHIDPPFNSSVRSGILVAPRPKQISSPAGAKYAAPDGA